MRNVSLLLLLTSTALTTFAAKPVNYPSVPLKVTVNAGQQFYSSATDIISDAQGPYVNGQNGVCASLNTTGDLIVDFDCASASPARQLGLTLPFHSPSSGGMVCSNPTPPSTIPTPSTPSHTNHLGTAKATDMPTAAFQAMTVDPTGSTIYYVEIFIATAVSDASQTAYRLNYHGTLWSSFSDAPLASYAEVRRISNTEWIVESVAPSALSGNPPNIAMLVQETSTKHSSTTTECGFYTVPFSFTLDQQ